jgi:HlyD family secretion protein
MSLLRKHRLLTALVVIALVIAGYLGWRRVVGVEVEVVTPERREMVHSVVTSGRVRPLRIQLAPVVSGRVDEILVEEGARVASGQVLIRLEHSEASAAVSEAEAALAQASASRQKLRTISRKEADEVVAQAEARLEDAQRDLDRIREMVASGLVGSESLEEAETTRTLADSALRSARAQRRALDSTGASTLGAQAAVEQAEAALSLAKARLAYRELTAPADGIVLSRNVEVGDAVTANSVVLELAASSRTELVVEPDERNLSLLRVGQSALASAEAFSEERFAATVSFIAPAVDRRRGTIELRLHVPDPPDYLRPDMTVSVDIEVGRKEDALVLPIDAVQDLAGEPWVLVANDGRATRRPVEVGIRDTRWVEIISGLAGDEVVLARPEQARAGQRVRARATAP